MDFWRWFRQLSKIVQIVIIVALLALLLVAAFDRSAGENIVSVVLALGTLLGASKISKHQ
jgi:hypothetical protein